MFYSKRDENDGKLIHTLDNEWSDSIPWDGRTDLKWWRHEMDTFSALLTICAGKFTGDRWIAPSKPIDAYLWCIFLICALNKRLSKQSRGWWFETPSRSLWHHCKEMLITRHVDVYELKKVTTCFLNEYGFLYDKKQSTLECQFESFRTQHVWLFIELNVTGDVKLNYDKQKSLFWWQSMITLARTSTKPLSSGL